MKTVKTSVTFSNRLDHLSARLGINRSGHRVEPGIYKLGDPGRNAPVFVTANYTLSFDALRSNLKGRDSFILVLDTKGVNVWCAAGKGTFGTEELVRQIGASGLKELVDHHTLILPQLGAPGVEAHKVKEHTGFRVKYGPVRAADIPEYMERRDATPEMRRVRFPLAERLTLVPVELVHMLIPILAIGVALFFTIGPIAAFAATSSILGGTVFFPLLLPILPTRNFSTKGYFLGLLIAVVFGILNLFYTSERSFLLKIISTAVCFLALPSATAFLSLNFTGSTTFTSRTGVRNEIFRYFPSMVWLFGAGLVLFISSLFIYFLKL